MSNNVFLNGPLADSRSVSWFILHTVKQMYNKFGIMISIYQTQSLQK